MKNKTTPEEFTRVVGISQAAVSKLLSKGILTRDATLKQWLSEYTANLRKIADGKDCL